MITTLSEQLRYVHTLVHLNLVSFTGTDLEKLTNVLFLSLSFPS